MAGVDALAADLAELARGLRDAGDEGLRKEVVSAIRDAASTIPPAIRAGLRPHLPDRYADVLDADLAIGVSVLAARGTVRVTATTRGPAGRRRLRRLDQGVLAHPLFGRRRHWYDQGEPSVAPGFFSGPAGDAQPRVRRDIEDALDRVKEQIWAGVRR